MVEWIYQSQLYYFEHGLRELVTLVVNQDISCATAMLLGNLGYCLILEQGRISRAERRVGLTTEERKQCSTEPAFT